MAKGPSKTQIVAEQNHTLLSIIKDRARVVEERQVRNVERSFSLKLATDDLFFQKLEVFCDNLFKQNPIKAKPYKLRKGKTAKRHLHLVLSDLHIRSLLDPRELPHKYGQVEEARRLAKVAIETAEYKTVYRDDTILNVLLLGDLIQGILDHDPRDGAPLAEQVAAAIHLLVQVLTYLAQHFPEVRVYCATGNHGRNPQRHKARAMHQKWDSFETIIYYALKTALIPYKNVKFEIPYTPYFTYESLGHHILGTHGDTFIEVGNPGENIKVGTVTKKINEVNATRPHGQRVEVVATGHVHVGSRTRLNNGVVLVTNGALVPPDGFMVNGVGKLEMTNCQALWESTEKYPAGDFRELTVDAETDADSSLDAVVQPFESF